VFYILFKSVSSIVRRVLTRELRGECGAGGFSVARGMMSRGRGDSGVTRPLYVTNFDKIILSLYNFYYFVPFIALYMEHAATFPSF